MHVPSEFKMNQEKIWAYFQNEGEAAFESALPRYRYIQSRLKKLAATPAKVLNIGVGTGKLEDVLAKSGYLVSALDPDLNAINKLVNVGIDAHVGIAQLLPFPGGSFDVVIASEVLEHLTAAESRDAISEVLRVLKKGGYFIGTVPYREPLADNLTVCPCCGERFHRWGHLQSFDREILAALFASGFSSARLSRRAFVRWSTSPKALIKSAFRYVLGRVGEQIAVPHFYFECRKK